ncbi:hypothetical protein OsI_02340 [Oryza sativa Indica Group]|uniref:Uncharacterized protein n=1 Tax=Oryza sativa subsp. indica TaxID=39946 RepID=B8AA27_ORYSI|nr:hypothetical protein OsI_02340 [Oryza sativa Indica Group]
MIIPIVLQLLIILGNGMAMVAAQPWHTCGASNYTADSMYRLNLDGMSASLFPEGAGGSGGGIFVRGSSGADPDKVYAVALCRGDVDDAPACSSCFNAAFRRAMQLCPRSKDAAIYYDECLLRFSDTDILNMDSVRRLNTSEIVDGALVLMNLTSEPMLPGWDDDSRSTATTNFTGFLKTMLTDVVGQVLSTRRHYAAIRMEMDDGSSSSTTAVPREFYCLAQCAPDLIEDICYSCLTNFSDRPVASFPGRQGWRVLGLWCNLRLKRLEPLPRYDTKKFYTGAPTWSSGSSASNAIVPSPAPQPASLPPPTRKHKSKMNTHEDEALIWGLEGRSSEFTVYDFSHVLEATGNFSEENKLGQGGFGPVYKGRFPDGVEIAVKRLASHSGQGLTEFKNEIQLIAKLQHTNLVRLLGCCYQRQEKILVYEYLPNKSLDFFIFDETRRALVDWNKRLAIINGIAQGLLYLHKHSRLRIIHRDLKAGNILLDHEMNPKISDFGLAKIFSTNDTEGNTKRIVGTYGYMAPEYASEGLFSIKSDVFSFGVLILETVSGKRTSSFHRHGDFINLLGHAWQMWKDETWLQLVDTSLVIESHTPEMARCINIALLCVQENAADRPTMSEVVAMLTSESLTLPEPKYPAFYHMRVTKEEPSTVIMASSANGITLSVVDGR